MLPSTFDRMRVSEKTGSEANTGFVRALMFSNAANNTEVWNIL